MIFALHAGTIYCHRTPFSLPPGLARNNEGRPAYSSLNAFQCQSSCSGVGLRESIIDHEKEIKIPNMGSNDIADKRKSRGVEYMQNIIGALARINKAARIREA